MSVVSELSPVLQTRPVVVCYFDADGNITERSGSFLPTKFINDTAIANSCDFIFGVPETMSPGEDLLLEGVHFEADGSGQYIVDASLNCLSNDSFRMVIEDQTDRYKMINQISQQRNEADIFHHRLARQNEQLTILKQAAEAASRTRTEFLAKVSHEIRTPLNALLGFAEMLGESTLDPQQQRQLDHIRTAGNALSGLLNDLLDLSKMESGKYQIEVAKFGIAGVFEDALTLCQSKAQEKGLNLTLDIDPDIPAQMLGDRLRISQVILNLLTNAIKFTDHGGVDVTAKCGEVTPVTTVIQFDVSDSGRGIPLEQQSQIFERFSQSQLADSTELGGVGLGLAIVRQLVEAMGGEIGVSSELGSGARFTVSLPLKRLPEGDASEADVSDAEVPAQLVTAEKQDLEGVTILIAEDSALNQQYVREILEPHGAALHIVESGAEAIQTVLSEPVDLVLMDIHMPGMNGDEAIKRIRNDLLFPLNQVPVIVFTGKASDEEQATMIEIGADQALSKPYTPQVLIKAVVSGLAKDKTAFAAVDKLLSDDVSQQMIDIFKDEVPVYLRDLLLALFNQQEKQFVFQAHKMQSAMWVMELMDFYALLTRLENEPLGFEDRLQICTELCEGVQQLLHVTPDGSDS